MQSSKPLECTARRVNPNVNRGLWVMTMCQCRFMGSGGGTDGGRGCVVGGWGRRYTEIVLLAHFCGKPETALNHKVY